MSVEHIGDVTPCLGDCLFAENAPAWMCITGPSYSVVESKNNKGEDPARKTARLAKLAELHKEALDRKEKQRSETLGLSQRNRELNKILREQRSRERKAEKLAARKTPEELALIRKEAGIKIKAKFAAKRAAKGPRKRIRPKSENHIAPEGYLVLSQAAKKIPCSPTTIKTAVNRGEIAVIKKGRFYYVRLEDVEKYLASSLIRRYEASVKTLKLARTKKALQHSQAISILTAASRLSKQPREDHLVQVGASF